MNNKGFTLVEILVSLCIISIILIFVVFSINRTTALSKENAYKIMKNNINKTANIYITECENFILDCSNDYVWKDNKTSFKVNKLIDHGYFSQNELINPVNDKDLSNCLKLEITKKENKTYDIIVNDTECK